MAEPSRPPGGGGAGDEGLGRSRGGFTSRIHLSADGRCRPLSLVVTPGQRADFTQFKSVLEKIRVPRLGPGRPRRKPDSLAADKAYSNGPVRDYLRRRGVRRSGASASPLGSRRCRPERPGRRQDRLRVARWCRQSKPQSTSPSPRRAEPSRAVRPCRRPDGRGRLHRAPGRSLRPLPRQGAEFDVAAHHAKCTLHQVTCGWARPKAIAPMTRRAAW
ncbi:transposase [Streptomyces sp. NBC_01707]|uniref:transposase n=1 Tax=Streptomyces sp. NBC_01707 TaxID=2975914 RepID=UPI00352C17FD